MFTRAGFNPRYSETGIVARVAIIGGTRRGWAKLIRFRCGDLAWYRAGTFLCWGLRARILNWIHLPVPYGGVAASRVVDRVEVRSFA